YPLLREKLLEPRSSDAEASIRSDDGALVHLRCVDSRFRSDESPPAFYPLDIFRSPGSRSFFDPREIYPLLREKLLEPRSSDAEALFDAAILVSRYDYRLPETWKPRAPTVMSADAQRDLLALILTGAHPERGLELLRASGFVSAFWPELALLPGTSQSKEYHPEGDAWEHTLETFRHRKLPELRLSLALLLHDTGKPRSVAMGPKRFDRHAEIGRAVAEKFLRRLGFAEKLVSDVSYLTRWHMLPAALPRLPIDRSREAIEDPRFPLLLELYRCDELSTFRGPDGYYEACAAYQDWLRNARNPWRDEEGRKLARLYVEAVPRQFVDPRPRSLPGAGKRSIR
ncbi:MAG: HD domain-containing protein, partial [Spirochaetota bacterium]